MCLPILLASCVHSDKPKTTLFRQDVNFLKKYTQVLILTSPEGQSQIAVLPELQGRIITSTAAGPDGPSFGWINRQVLASGENNVHMNAFGGEDRFWLGPEGGQYAIFFKKGDPFDLQHWFTPPPINEGRYQVVQQDAERIVFQKEMEITNYADFVFHVTLMRETRLLRADEISSLLGIDIPATLKWVGFESNNIITNTGVSAWRKESGLLSIWILGMFNPSPTTVVAAPFLPGSESERGPVVVSDYFGPIPPDRLQVHEHALFFKADGKYRSKIGIPRARVKPIFGSYDSALGVLTLVQFTVPDNAKDYVNSLWEITDRPYSGDVANSYNDGPAAPGAKPMGPFYELESSSPAAELAPGAYMSHTHRTIHIMGDKELLDKISRATLGVALIEFKKAF